MFPSDCVLDRGVLTDAGEDPAATKLPLFTLKCKYRKAEGYADDKIKIYNKRLEDMVVGVRLAEAPPAVSYLAIQHSESRADVVAVDKTLIVMRLEFPYEAHALSYLIYDAVASSLRMIPGPNDTSWEYILTSDVSVARPSRGPDYELIHTGHLLAGDEDCLFLWRPSSSSPPWSEYKKTTLPDNLEWSPNSTATEFSFNGHAYWMDLLCGISYCSCDALFDDNSSSVVKFGGFIPLPVEERGHLPDSETMPAPDSYRAMGVVRDDFIRFVSINGFQQDYVQLKDRTVTVWDLLGHDEGWHKVHEFSLEMLWGFEGFCDLPKDLTPMYPLLSTKDTDVIYLGLGEYREIRFGFQREFNPSAPSYLLAVDMRNKIVRTSVSLEDKKNWFEGLLSCGFDLFKAVDGPYDGEGIPMKKKRPIPMKKQRPIPMKKSLILMKKSLILMKKKKKKKKPRMMKPS